MDRWRSWLEQALQDFEVLKAQEASLFKALKEVERAGDFAQGLRAREQWFDARTKSLALNEEIVRHLGAQPDHR